MIAVYLRSSNLSEYISFLKCINFHKLIKTIDDIKNNNDISMILLRRSNISNSK